MENKLQELTQKLYNEGLSKGREQADQLVVDAQAQAKKIIAEAQAQADKIAADATRSAEELSKNTQTEVALAARNTVSALKQSIAEMVVAKVVSGAVAQSTIDPKFVKEMMLTVAKNWNGAGSTKTDLAAQLPANLQSTFEKEFSASAQEFLGAGVEITYSTGIKSGFRIAPKNGGYYISFTDADFDALIGEYLRPKVAKLLFDK